jgi:hypothetical protein
MAIVAWPVGITLMPTVRCVICGKDVPPTEASAGSFYYDGRQAFACSDHFRLRRTWVLGWARFALEQSRKAEFRSEFGFDYPEGGALL